MRKLLSIFLLISSLLAVDVTFTVVDNSWSNTSVMYKGTATDWAVVQMFDDGTNGDVTADDHTWTVVVDVLPAIMNGVLLILQMVMVPLALHAMDLMGMGPGLLTEVILRTVFLMQGM